MNLKQVLQDDLLLLRCLTEQDASPAYLAWLHDPEINRFLESRFQPPRNMEDLARFIAHTNKSSHTLLLGIFLQSKKQHIGNIKLGPLNRIHGLADVGFLIGSKSDWGKGYASRAIRLV